MLHHILDKNGYLISRIFSYFSLSLILLVSVIETQTNAKHLILIAYVILFLLYEPTLLQKIEYRFGKVARKNIRFLLDICFVSCYITAMHVPLIPTFVIIGTLMVSAIFGRIHSVVLIVAPILGLAVYYISAYLFFGFAIVFQPVSLELNLLSIFSFMLLTSIGLYTQQRRTQLLIQKKQHYFNEMNRYFKLNNQLARYAPTQLWQSIMRGEVEAKVEYQRRKLTVFFSDIQGFTDLSEQLIPEDLAFLLNDYLKHMTDIAKQYGATVDKFMGDGILIFFGDPESRGIKEDALACIDMAVMMRQQMRILRERWIKMGYASLHIRMGVATGYCHVGNYGTIHRMSYTIVGRDVNLAARLQAAADVDQILISEETFDLVKDQFLCIKNKPLKLKGIQDTVATWQVVKRYHTGAEQYQRWYDFEYKGFNLLLNIDKTSSYEYSQLIDALQQTIGRLKLQQETTDIEGVVLLEESNIISLPTEEKK